MGFECTEGIERNVVPHPEMAGLNAARCCKKPASNALNDKISMADLLDAIAARMKGAPSTLLITFYLIPG